MAKIIGDVVGVPNPKSDWSQNDRRKADYIKNKPDLSAYANVLKGTASGEVVAITDISPIEHNMAVKLFDANATLSVYGRNLFSNNTDLIKSVTYNPINGEPSSRFGYIISLPCGTYTMRAIREDAFTNQYIYGAIVEDNVDNVNIDYNIIQSGLTTVANNVCRTVTFEIKSGEKLFVYNGSSTSTLNATKTLFGNFDIQLEVGESATPFERYIEPITYTPNADGTVDNVKIIYPNMTLMADKQGVLVECGYNKDTNKVIENLVNAIISLGGNV